MATVNKQNWKWAEKRLDEKKLLLSLNYSMHAYAHSYGQ